MHSAFLSFFEKIEAKEKKKPGTIAKIFDTHPPTPNRVKAAQEEIATILPPRNQYILDTSEFDQVKARLAAIENGHKLQNHNENRPTLRRAQNNQKKDDDGPPTLKTRSDDGGPETADGR